MLMVNYCQSVKDVALTIPLSLFHLISIININNSLHCINFLLIMNIYEAKYSCSIFMYYDKKGKTNGDQIRAVVW